MSKKKLAIKIQKEVITYLYDSLPLCFIVNNENLNGWYLNHYISLYLMLAKGEDGYNCHSIRYVENGLYLDYCK